MSRAVMAGDTGDIHPEKDFREENRKLVMRIELVHLGTVIAVGRFARLSFHMFANDRIQRRHHVITFPEAAMMSRARSSYGRSAARLSFNM